MSQQHTPSNNQGTLNHGVAWQTAVITVTPAMASKWLARNEDNRPLSLDVVRQYATAMREGEWMITPDAICLAVGGRLLNGQHRLSAVVESNTPTPMFVLENVDEYTFQYLDRGRKRSRAFALGLSPGFAAVANLAVTVASGGKSGHLDYIVAEAADALNEPFARLMTAYASNKPNVVTGAPFRLACCLRMMTDGSDYALKQYVAMCQGPLRDLSPACEATKLAIDRMAIKSIAGGKSQRELLARAWITFDRNKAASTTVVVRNVDTHINQIAKVIHELGIYRRRNEAVARPATGVLRKGAEHAFRASA